MPDSQNLEPRIYSAGYMAYDPTTGNFDETLVANVLPADMGDFKYGNASWCVQMLALMQQVWARLIIPDTPQVAATTGIVTGSNQVVTGLETISRVQFIATSFPPAVDAQPGNPPRFPHIGHLAFIYGGMGGLRTFGETKYITMDSQTFFPENQSAGGFWYRLNPGYAGIFTAGDWAVKRHGYYYGYSLSADHVVNPYLHAPALQEPSV